MVHRQKFIKYLNKHGITCLRSNGKHHIFQNKSGIRYSVPLHSKTVSAGAARKVAKKFNIPQYINRF